MPDRSAALPFSFPMIHHRVHPSLRLLTIRWRGQARDAEMISAYRRIYEDPAWEPGMDEYVDVRGTDPSGVTGGGLKDLAGVVAEYVTRSPGPFRTAVVVARDVGMGIARMYEAYAGETPKTMRIFREPAEALAWLGQPLHLAEEVEAMGAPPPRPGDG